MSERITKRQAVHALIELSTALGDHEYNAPDEGEYDPIAELRQYIEQWEPSDAQTNQITESPRPRDPRITRGTVPAPDWPGRVF